MICFRNLLVFCFVCIAGSLAPAMAAESISVNTALKYQTMRGWEAITRSWEINKGTNAYDGTWVTYAPLVADHMVNELGVNRIAMPLSTGWANPVDYWSQFVNGQLTYTQWQSHSYEATDPNVHQTSEFDFYADTVLVPMKQRLAARGEKLYVNMIFGDFAASNPAPYSFQANPAAYAAFAQFYVDRLKTKYGVVLDAFSMINEPDNSGWDGVEIGSALVAVKSRLSAAGYANINYIAPSVAAASNTIPYANSIGTVSGALQALDTLTYHRYQPGDYNAIHSYAQAHGLETGMSEYYNATMDTLFDDLLLGQVSSWQKWAIAGLVGGPNPQGRYISADISNPSNPVITLAPNTAALSLVFRHVRMGAVRVDAQSSTMRTVAFVNTDGSQVLVARRAPGSGSASVTIAGLKPGTYGMRTATVAASQATDLADVVVPAAGSVTVSLPEGYTTLYAKSSSAPPPGQLSFAATTGFGNQVVGTTSAATVITVSNVGGTAVTVQGITSSNAQEFPVTGSTCGQVSAGSSCVFSLSFKPRATGARNTTLTVASNGVGSPQTATASGTGVPAASPGQLSIPATTAFGNQTVGSTSAAKSITISNVGGSAVSVQSITSGNASEFPITGSTCGTVAAGATCALSLAFKPAAAGARSTTLTIASNGVGSPQTAGATGTGVAGSSPGQLSFAASTAFGNQTVGSTSGAKTVTVTNVGGAAVSVQSIVSSNATEFPVTSSNCGTVSPGSSCAFTVAFKPSATGSRTATITVNSNGTGSPQTSSATGTGVAAVGQLSLAATTTFASQLVGTTSAPNAITVSNTGTAKVTIQSIASNNTAEFPVSSSCTSLNPGASCSFSVSFKPAVAGARSGKITVTSDGVGSPQSLTATGNGFAGGRGQLSVPPTITFATQSIGSTSGWKSVSLTNVGTAAVTVSGMTSDNAEFHVVSSNCSRVDPQATCTVNLTFAPSAHGTRKSKLMVTSDGVGSPQFLALSGYASGNKATLASGPIDMIEYHHAAWDHYFVTGDADEIAKLDSGAFWGWARTGLQFKAYALDAADGNSVCRFFSTSFAPKSSHFYTPFADECTTVSDNADWSLEGEVFTVQAPASDGTCPAGTDPVYRLYNDGQGAAPNHRYTTDFDVRSQMIEQGWIPEGLGDAGVIMCSPQQ
jgi:hypothetical protein